MVSASIVLFVFTSNIIIGQNKKTTVMKIVNYYMKLKSNKLTILKKQFLSALGPSEQIEKRKMAIETETIKRQKPSCQQISSFYAENFNIVDTFNSLWYDIKWPHTNMKAITHVTWSIVHTSIINTYVAWCELKERTMKKRGKIVKIQHI